MAKSYSPTSYNLLGGLVDMPQQHVMRIALLGVLTGIGGWILAALIQRVALEPLFCGNASSMACHDAALNAGNIASILLGLVALLFLVRISTYRPLLIVLAVIVSLWGIGAWTATLPWYEAVSWWALLYAFAYLAFAWLVRPRAFAPTAVLVIIAVVLLRWIAML